MTMDELAGYRLLLVPEAATLLTRHGMSFQDGEVLYQRAILDFQRNVEKTYMRYAEDLGCDVAVICDRGALDGAVYCGQAAFEDIMVEVGIAREDLLTSYDGVLYLVSAAVGAADAYGKASNETRRESLEEAAELEAATFACWKDHPNICVVDNEGGKTFLAKMDEAVAGLMEMLDDN